MTQLVSEHYDPLSQTLHVMKQQHVRHLISFVGVLRRYTDCPRWAGHSR